MERRLLGVGVLVPPVALLALALALHPEDTQAILIEILWGAGLVAAGLGAITAVLGLASVIADRFWPRPTPPLDLQPESHLLLKMLFAEVVVTIGLVWFWLEGGHLELAFWCGALLGASATVAVLVSLGVIEPVESSGGRLDEH